MARIIVAQFITLDGVTEDPDGSDGTGFGGWAFRHGRDAVAGDKFAYGSILRSGVFMFGRRTWDHFSTLWPSRTDPFAQALNAADKVVVTSRGVDANRWQNTRVIDADPLAWARAAAEHRDVVIIGSHSLVEVMQTAHAVDEYRLRMFPTATGAGRRLFPQGMKLDIRSNEAIGPTVLMIGRPLDDETSPAAGR